MRQFSRQISVFLNALLMAVAQAGALLDRTVYGVYALETDGILPQKPPDHL